MLFRSLLDLCIMSLTVLPIIVMMLGNVPAT